MGICKNIMFRHASNHPLRHLQESDYNSKQINSHNSTKTPTISHSLTNIRLCTHRCMKTSKGRAYNGRGQWRAITAPLRHSADRVIGRRAVWSTVEAKAGLNSWFVTCWSGVANVIINYWNIIRPPKHGLNYKLQSLFIEITRIYWSLLRPGVVSLSTWKVFQ